jgi:hypothetical protein
MSTAKNPSRSDIRVTEGPIDGFHILAKVIARVHSVGEACVNGTGRKIEGTEHREGQPVTIPHNYGQRGKGLVGNGNEDVS